MMEVPNFHDQPGVNGVCSISMLNLSTLVHTVRWDCNADNTAFFSKKLTGIFLEYFIFRKDELIIFLGFHHTHLSTKDKGIYLRMPLQHACMVMHVC